jgi:hypothetical protein
LTRCVFRYGLIAGLALGGLTLLVGPERVAAGLGQIRSKAQNAVDRCVDDPVALRHQLEQLAREYPSRIAKVNGEVAQVSHQLARVEEEIDMGTRVVGYATEDLGALKIKIAKAEEAVQTRLASTGAGNPQVFIRFKGVRYDLDGAYGEVIRIGNQRHTYQDQVAFNTEQLKMLQEQKVRLEEVMAKLMEDHTAYQAQLWTLDRQIDAIGRNERLIDLLEEQQATLESYDKYTKVGNLDQIHARLAELRTRQEAQIEALRQVGVREDYEKRARFEMEQADVDSAQDILDQIMKDVDDAGQPTEEEKETPRSVAWVDPIIIE